MADKFVTLMVIPESGEQRRGYRLRLLWLKIGLGTFAAVVIAILLFFVFYGTMLSRALRTEQLAAENEELKKYRYKVQLLEANIQEMRTIVSEVAGLAGIDVAFPELPDDSTLFAQINPEAGATIDRPADVDWSLPIGLPIRGFITQGFDDADGPKYHPGIDIAAAQGTPVLATGSGRVTYAAFDSTYGYMIVVKHNDSVTTLYGHNDTLLVTEGQEVVVGSRLALSGSTGVSTAPHLHYELRINDQPINPLDNPYD